MPTCAVCGDDNNCGWTPIEQTYGTDSLPYDSKLAHSTCKIKWNREQSAKHQVVIRKEKHFEGTITDINSKGLWITR